MGTAEKKDGKGYEYLSLGHVVGLDGKIDSRGNEKTVAYGQILKGEVNEFSI